jgi:phosphatidate cytidylyltransferase
LLKQRIITAVILLLALLPAVFATSFEFFAALALLTVVVAQWEWARLLGFKFWPGMFSAVALGLLCVSLWDKGFPAALIVPLCWAAVVSWVIALLLTLPRAALPPALKSGLGQYLHLAFAIFSLCAAWCVMVLAKKQGAAFVLTLLFVVWAADIFAYFVGKRFGRHKLAPRISPGKTWQGAWGGVAGAVLVCLIGMRYSGTFFAELADGNWAKGAALTALLAMLSVMGDLYESLLKRQAGMKDSSELLPGHGGVLDRVDALIPTLPLAWLML